MLKLVPISIGFGIVFGVLTHWSACNPGRPWWRKREIVTDICHWFFIPLAARFVRIGLMVMGAAYLFDIYGAEALIMFYDDGFGPWPTAAMGAGTDVFGCVGLPDILDLSWFSRRPSVEIPCRASFLGRPRLDLRGEISSVRNIFFGTVLVDVGLLLAGISPNVMLWLGRSRPLRRPWCTPI